MNPLSRSREHPNRRTPPKGGVCSLFGVRSRMTSEQPREQFEQFGRVRGEGRSSFEARRGPRASRVLPGPPPPRVTHDPSGQLGA
jgi:hypothetical protein